MAQGLSGRRRFPTRRVLVASLISLSMAALAWFAVGCLSAEDSGRTQVAKVGGDSLGLGEPQQSTNVSRVKDGSDGAIPAATETPLRPDLGLEEIVREFILTLYGGETGRPDSGYNPSTYAKLESTDLTIKRRGQFELDVRGQFGIEFLDDPYYLMLQKSMIDNWNLCLKEYGLPSLEGLGQLPEEQQDALMKERNLVGDRMRELEDKCWEQSRIFAGKDEETDRLLGLQHQYYLSAAHVWVKANPDKVVPLPD